MLGLLQSGELSYQNSADRDLRFDVIYPHRIFEKDRVITTISRKRKKKKERYQSNFRFTLEQYEYIARLAKSAIHNSMQRIIDDKIFSRPWKEELEALRKQQARIGFPDSDFYPRALKIKMGLKGKRGRRPRAIYRRAA